MYYQQAQAQYVAAQASADDRVRFIVRTYLHLFAAIVAFVALEAAIFLLVPTETLLSIVATVGTGYGWLAVLGGFILVSYVADRWARRATSLPTQYAGLALYVVAEAVIFVPILLIAGLKAPGIIPKAGLITLLMFVGLTGVVFVTRKDFSFLRGVLGVAAIAALVLIGLSIVFGFTLGVLFSVVMIAVACGYILYHTSNVLHHYRTDQYVAAALALFAAVALLFWYVLRLLTSRD